MTNYASINNTIFTGIPSAPTAMAGTNTTQLATCAFVSTMSTVINGYDHTVILILLMVFFSNITFNSPATNTISH